MAVTEHELEISNKSYTNKDFESIYTELLDYACKLSKRFSPIDSNESDPFIVMLKLASFVADKVNYNVDKNILEKFLLSCTQETSMHDITERLGYHMAYYKSAETGVIFKYSGLDSSLTIPKYSILNTADNIQYVTTAIATINKTTGVSTEIKAMQGQLKTLSVLDSTVINLENLDNNRIYFSESMVAQNGVFINNSVYDDDWKCVDNLNTQLYGDAVYRFGYDSSKKLPYLEFPDWIINIIGDGLTIKYLISDGVAGNISAKALTSVVRNGSTGDDIEDSDIIVQNLSAATNGADPETIDATYLGFKKVIGTFDNLVTCRDYANAIYNAVNAYDNPYVSNVQVGDRRNDLNYNCDVVTMTPQGPETRTIISTSSGSPIIDPFDLCVYALKPLTNNSYVAVNTSGGYNESYDLTTPGQRQVIYSSAAIQEKKTLSHVFKSFENTDIISIRNYYKLDAVITTSTKVDILEQQEILININDALIKAYNPRSLSFGNEIPFDLLISTIENADPRIKNVSLQEPEQTPKIVTANNTEHNLVENSANTDQFKFIVAKNILSGRVALFEYDTDFDYSYVYKDLTKNEAVRYMQTYANFNSLAGNSSMTLQQNEVVEFIAPHLITTLTYPYGICYHLSLASGNSISAQSEYQLTGSDSFVVTYTDSSDQVIITPYSSGTIISPNFTIYTTSYMESTLGRTPTKHGVTNGTYPTEYANTNFFTLGTKEEVAIKDINSEKLESFKKCYWLTNNENNQINWTSDGSNFYYILGDDEYFFYSDSLMSSLNAYGCGTKLICNATSTWTWEHSNYVSADKITEDGLASLSSVFIDRSFSSTAWLQLVENEIITLIEGDKLNNTSGTAYQIQNNIFNAITSGVTFTYTSSTGETNILPDRSTLSAENQWKVRGVLDVNAGPDAAQTLNATNGNQTVLFIPLNASSQPDYSNPIVLQASAQVAGAKSFKLSVLTQRTGCGLATRPTTPSASDLPYIDLRYIGVTLDYEYPKLLAFNIDDNVSANLMDYDTGYYSVRFNGSGQSITRKLNVNSPAIAPNTKDRYVMIYISGITSPTTLTAASFDSADTEIASLIKFNATGTEAAASTLSLSNGLNLIKIKDVSSSSKCAYINLVATGDETGRSTITTLIAKLKVANGINSHLGLLPSTDIIDYMRTNFAEQWPVFYATNDLDSAKQIETSSSITLASSQAFYDSNNIANSWVIPKIDFTNSEIKIARTSKK